MYIWIYGYIPGLSLTHMVIGSPAKGVFPGISLPPAFPHVGIWRVHGDGLYKGIKNELVG